MKPRFLLVRSEKHPTQNLGNLHIMLGAKTLFRCKTLELPYRDNRNNVSSVPVGTYEIVKEISSKFGMCWELKGVPNRSECKIHQGNFFYQIEGCILVGDMHLKIDADESPDVRNSKATLLKMMRVLDDYNVNKTTITIVDMNDLIETSKLN